MHAPASTTALSIVPTPGRAFSVTVAAIRLHYRKLFGRDLTEAEAARAAARTYVAAVEHAHLRRSISLKHATLWSWKETPLEAGLFASPPDAPAVAPDPKAPTLAVEMDEPLRLRVEYAMHLAGFVGVTAFLASAADFHLRLLEFYEDRGWWGKSWLCVGGCWRRRWYWPFGRPKGTTETDLAGRRLDLVLAESAP